MIARRIRAALIALAFASTAASAASTSPASVDARASEVRAELERTPGQQASPRTFLLRQLLTSLERRRDLERTRNDLAALSEQPHGSAAPPPTRLLELDDLRRELQQLDETLAGGEQRIVILRQDRSAAAEQLTVRVAALHQLEANADAGRERVDLARLEAQLGESTTAELDALLAVVELQQTNMRQRRSLLQSRLAGASGPARPSAQDEAAIEQRLDDRRERLQARLARAAAERDAAHAQLQQHAAVASNAVVETLTERLANRDIDVELAREALSNVTLERAAWQVALRYYRDGDVNAVVEAGERGPVARARLARRIDFFKTMADATLGRIGEREAMLAQAPDAPDAGERRAQLAAFQERLRLVQVAVLDARQLCALLDRLHSDFDARIGVATFGDRIVMAWAQARALFERGWNQELFAVEQTIDIDGRQTAVSRSVTVGKVIKAPLLVLLGVFAAFRLARWVERRARRRGLDEGRARLARRWTFTLLSCACALGSLLLAGIPFAAFAFVGGAVAIAIGFGTQTMFKNLISGVQVLIERPFRLGDVVEVGALRGTVVDIHLRACVVRDSDGADTLVPNSTMVEHSVKNVTLRSRVTRQSLDMIVDSDSDPRAVSDAMREAAERHGLLLDAPAPVVQLDDVTTEGLRFALHYWIELKSGVESSRVASDLRLMVLNAFREAGIRTARATCDARARAELALAPRSRTSDVRGLCADHA